MGHSSDFSSRDCAMHHELHEYSIETPEFLTKTVFHLSLSPSHSCAIRPFILLIDLNARGGMQGERTVQGGPGRQMGTVCTLLNAGLIQTSKHPALMCREPTQVDSEFTGCSELYISLHRQRCLQAYLFI